MTVPLRLLLIEDSQEDALLMLHELRRGDFALSDFRVDSAADLLEALKTHSWDIIISDYVMPHFSGLNALRLVREQGFDVPFFIVTDKISDDLAVEVMKAGAQDYLRKGNLSRLIPAINRELAEASVRRERKAGEEALRKLSCAVEQSSTMLLITDTNGVIEYVNPRFVQVTGYQKSETIGQKPKFLASGKTPREVYAQLKEAMHTGRDWKGEFLNRRKNGEFYWESAVISPVKDNQGHTTSFLKIADDTTDRKRMEEELRKAKEAAESANRAKTQFLANMSHELRTPLNGILGMTELLLDCPLDDKEHDFAGIIHHSASALLGIISDVLDFSKAESDQLFIEEIPFNLKNVIYETTRLIQGMAIKKGLTLSTEYDASIPNNLSGDPRRIGQLLLKLTGNALKFTERGSVKIEVALQSIEEERAHVVFRVSDTGIGILPEDCDRLFRPFEQVDGTSTRKYGGMGVGLVLTQRLITLLKGTIGVESRIGIGSTFHFTIPIRITKTGAVTEKVTATLEGAETPTLIRPFSALSETSVLSPLSAVIPKEPLEVPSPSEQKKRILVVEDDPVNRYLILSQLQTLGYIGQTAVNGQDAIEMIVQTEFDLILMDCQMPVLDGFAATRAIRRIVRSNRLAIPIIALTAHVTQADRDMCFAAGMDDYLGKPFKLEQLQEILQRWFSPGNPYQSS
ncbi:MAG: response regulator [Candidatus Ozemobacteraceae bacterium]